MITKWLYIKFSSAVTLSPESLDFHCVIFSSVSTRVASRRRKVWTAATCWSPSTESTSPKRRRRSACKPFERTATSFFPFRFTSSHKQLVSFHMWCKQACVLSFMKDVGAYPLYKDTFFEYTWLDVSSGNTVKTCESTYRTVLSNVQTLQRLQYEH